MGSTTPSKGYPYPVGTDRVMDGDDAIKALAESLDADGTLFTRSTPTGQSVTSTLSTPVVWNAPSVNGCGLTKTDATTWTVTKAGFYVITSNIATSAFTSISARAFLSIMAGSLTNNRQPFNGENAGVTSWSGPLVAGEAIQVAVFVSAAMSVTTAGYLHVARLGRA